MTSAGISHFPTRQYIKIISSSTMCFRTCYTISFWACACNCRGFYYLRKECIVLNLFIQRCVTFFLLHSWDWISSTNCLHSYIHLFQSNIKYWFQICFIIFLTPCTIYRAKTVSEFMHSNWITLSCYSCPKHKSLFPKYLIHSSSCLYTVI